MARALSVLAFDILRIRRRLILSNLKIAFPDLERDVSKRMGRESLYHFAATLFETIRGGSHDLLAHVSLKDRSILDQALQKEQGVYMLCIHMGNFEVLGGAISTFWRPATVPVKHLGNGGFDRYVHEQRLRYKIDPIRRVKKGDGFLAIRKALAEARPVGFMLDQARHGEPRLPLFGRPAKTNTSIAAIWRRCPAPLVPVYIRRISFGVHEVAFLPEVEFACTEDAESDIQNHSADLNKIVEKIVRMHPEQYWWIHNRWK